MSVRWFPLLRRGRGSHSLAESIDAALVLKTPRG